LKNTNKYGFYFQALKDIIFDVIIFYNSKLQTLDSELWSKSNGNFSY
jgi:hypothetical protein